MRLQQAAARFKTITFIKSFDKSHWIEQWLVDDETLKYISPFHILQASTHNATHIDGDP